MSIASPDDSMNNVPPWWRSGLDYVAALARYVAAGCPSVPKSVFFDRMRACSECALCRHGKCLLCGCNVESKAQMATECCPRDPPLWAKFACKNALD
jgi:hypothetical protein